MAALVLHHIEKGTATIANGGTSTTATLARTLTDRNKSILFTTWRVATNGATSFNVTGAITNTTTLTFTRIATTSAVTIEWEVLEFVQGITVQHGTTTISGSTTNQAINEITVAKSFPILTMRSTGTTWGADDMYTAAITSTTNLRFVGQSSQASVFEWQLVQIDDAAVQQVAAAFGANLTSDVAVTTIDPALTIWFATINASGTMNMKEVPYLSYVDTTTLRFTRLSTTLTLNYNVFVVSLPAGSISVQNVATTIASSGSAVSPAISTAIIPELTSLLNNGVYNNYATSNVTDDDAGYNALTLGSLTASAFTATRASTPAVTAATNVQVIQWTTSTTMTLIQEE